MSNRQTTPHARTSGHQGQPSMTERQLEAYLLSRDALRRIQRTAALFGEAQFRRSLNRSAH
jgi:hypothetical protein